MKFSKLLQEEFIIMITQEGLGVAKAATLLGVGIRTAERWLRHYKRQVRQTDYLETKALWGRDASATR